jgi:predicted RNase H-like HicB family nuclease
MTCHYGMHIYWSEEDSVFIVEFPEFPGAKTHGATYSEATKNGEEVLELLIVTYQEEGKKLPELEIVNSEI